MNDFKTPQENFWAGEFGVEYIARNRGSKLLASNIEFFARGLHRAQGIGSCIEFGANVGMNISALKLLYPEIEAFGIEINKEAAAQLGEVIPSNCIYNTSILDFSPTRQWDFTLIKTVLIHIEPRFLPNVYEKLVNSTSRYLMIAEYYSQDPVEVSYRGHSDRLFKRDFAGEIMDSYPEMKLIDYGFSYRRDPQYPQDDISWFLLEKRMHVP
jgi:pseudaminic acid biosynthesis-associated methylase